MTLYYGLSADKCVVVGYALVELNACTVESHRHHVVLADSKNNIEDLFFVKVFHVFCMQKYCSMYHCLYDNKFVLKMQ